MNFMFKNDENINELYPFVVLNKCIKQIWTLAYRRHTLKSGLGIRPKENWAYSPLRAI